MATYAHLDDDQLLDEVVTWSGRVAAGEAHLLGLIGEVDRREAWAGQGLLSCAHWLSWRTGLGLVAAREKVRVARALEELPDVHQAFGEGRLSYSQVRALTRVAARDDQDRWIDVARSSTAGQLERLVRGVRRARKVDEDARDPERAAWRVLATKTYDDDGSAVYRIVLPAEQAAVVDAALEAARAELARAAVPTDASAEATPPQAATLGDALVELARVGLDQASPAVRRRARPALTAQVDPLTGWGRLRDGELLPPTSLATVMRTLPGRGGTVRLRPLTDADLRRHDLGRRQRLPSAALRELLGTIDGESCRFPGCTRRRRLHAHHVRHWADGGTTDLANLLLLCSRHHTLVHAQGFSLEIHEDRRLDVATRDGVPVLRLPQLPWRSPDELDPLHRIGADTLPPDHLTARVDLDYAVTVLLQQSA